MSLVFLTGNHPRHFFVAQALARTGWLKALVIETREAHLPEPPPHLPAATRALHVRHFAEREKAETRFFGENLSLGSWAGVEILSVTRDELNGPKTHSLIDRVRPTLLLSYGVHKLTADTLARAPRYRWNIHGGLSPWYRGVITHFWPSYFLEPRLTGMTLHETTEAIDGGAVIHQTLAPLVRGDGVHELACRAVLGLVEELPELVHRLRQDAMLTPVPATTSGRIWRSSDWSAAHLHPVYDFYGNRIVDRCLDGEFGLTVPRLVRQF